MQNFINSANFARATLGGVELTVNVDQWEFNARTLLGGFTLLPDNVPLDAVQLDVRATFDTEFSVSAATALLGWAEADARLIVQIQHGPMTGGPTGSSARQELLLSQVFYIGSSGTVPQTRHDAVSTSLNLGAPPARSPSVDHLWSIFVGIQGTAAAYGPSDAHVQATCGIREVEYDILWP
jgi:hypothetical protein